MRGADAFTESLFTMRCLEDFVWAPAGLVDTDLSFLSFLELYRADVAECRRVGL